MHDVLSLGVPHLRRLDSVRALFRGGQLLPERAWRLAVGTPSHQRSAEDAHERRILLHHLGRPTEIERLMRHMDEAWYVRIQDWPERRRVVVFDEATQVLCKAVCSWSGIALGTHERLALSSNCKEMIEGHSSLGPRLWRAKRARHRAEQWARGVVERIRGARSPILAVSPARAVATHRDRSGQILSLDRAAGVLVDMICPVVAISWPVAFAALALHEHPEYAARLRQDDQFDAPFLHELGRLYPSHPRVGVRTDEPVQGLHVPFGGGLLVEQALKVAVRTLVKRVTYGVPRQNSTFSTSRIPARPQCGMILQNVQLIDSKSAGVPGASVGASLEVAGD